MVKRTDEELDSTFDSTSFSINKTAMYNKTSRIARKPTLTHLSDELVPKTKKINFQKSKTTYVESSTDKMKMLREVPEEPSDQGSEMIVSDLDDSFSLA